MTDAQDDLRARLNAVQFDAGQYARVYVTRIRAARATATQEERREGVTEALAELIEWVKDQGDGVAQLRAAMLLATEFADISVTVDAVWQASEAGQSADSVWAAGMATQTAIHDLRQGEQG